MPRQTFRRWPEKLLTAILLIFVAASIAFGGSGRDGVYVHGILQAIAGVGCAVLVLTWPRDLQLGYLRIPVGLLTCFFGVSALQCIPLPVAIWQSLPGRSIVVEGHASLDMAMGAMPVSLDVQATLVTMGYALPPLFVILMSVRIGIERLRAVIPWFLVLVAVTSVLIGLAQIIIGRDSALYFYEFTNRGFPVGPFANVNHFASLTLMMFPFAAYLLSEAGKNWKESDLSFSLMLVSVAILLILAVGIFSAGSLAIYLLTLPVIILTSVAAAPQKRAMSGAAMRAVVLMGLVLGVALVATSPYLKNLGVTDFADGPSSRYQIWLNTWEGIRTHWVLGTGVGTYQSVIPMFEDSSAVTSTYVARAHNEFLQLVMEMGVLGVILIFVALSWLMRRIWDVWGGSRGGATTLLRKLASVSVVVTLLHSIVDFPARTPAIAIVLALCIALIALPMRQAKAPIIKVAENPKRVIL